MIDNIKDFDNQFFRMITISLAKTMNKSIRWINHFQPLNENETGRKRVLIPFYTSLTGEERFVFDSFVDDIVDTRLTMNTDQYQRGVITFNGFNTKSDEFANPNQYLSKNANINGVLRRIISKVKAIPISITYDVEIQLATENEIDKCSQKILNLLYNYFFFNIDYFGIKIDAILKLPDDKTIEIPREISIDSERRKSIKFSLNVETYYPIFNIDSDDLIQCDNDDDINWEYLGVPKPTEDYIQSLKDYNASNNNLTVKGGDSLEIEGLGEIKRSYYNVFYNALAKNQQEVNEDRLNIPPKDWNKFNV